MNQKKILLTAFRGTSSEALLENITEYEILLLPNDKVKDSQMLIEAISKVHFDYVISFGQRPNIKDKVHIETTARDKTKQLQTDFDCERIRQMFETHGLVAKLSENAGTSFCNRLYWNGLKHISEKHLETQMVFIHVPYEKNITDFEGFQEKIFEIMREDFQ